MNISLKSSTVKLARRVSTLDPAGRPRYTPAHREIQQPQAGDGTVQPWPWGGKILDLEYEVVSSSFRCAVMTPNGATFDGEVTYASFPAWDGQYGVMAGMSPLLDRLGVGPLRLDTTEGSRWFAVEDGFAHVRDNKLTILSESVYPLENLSLAELQKALRELESNENAELSAEDIESRRTRLTARLRLAENHVGNRNA